MTGSVWRTAESRGRRCGGGKFIFLFSRDGRENGSAGCFRNLRSMPTNRLPYNSTRRSSSSSSPHVHPRCSHRRNLLAPRCLPLATTLAPPRTRRSRHATQRVSSRPPAQASMEGAPILPSIFLLPNLPPSLTILPPAAIDSAAPPHSPFLSGDTTVVSAVVSSAKLAPLAPRAFWIPRHWTSCTHLKECRYPYTIHPYPP